MQQHSGEHIVSGILCGKFGCDNVGFHIGHELVTIDFNAALSTEDMIFVENRANRYIWEDHSLQISFPSPARLESGQDRQLAGGGLLRLLRDPCEEQRTGGDGKAYLLPEVPGRGSDRDGRRWTGAAVGQRRGGAEYQDIPAAVR